jgi:hypothetical protein
MVYDDRKDDNSIGEWRLERMLVLLMLSLYCRVVSFEDVRVGDSDKLIGRIDHKGFFSKIIPFIFISKTPHFPLSPFFTDKRPSPS